MTYFTRATAVAAALAAAAGLAMIAPAQAAPRAGVPGDWLYLTVTQSGSTAGPRGTLLLCDPPQGHPHATEACAQLATAGGDIDRIPPADVFCTMLYAPVTARAHGRWHGRPVEYRRTFSNTCVMKARTGSVFALDR